MSDWLIFLFFIVYVCIPGHQYKGLMHLKHRTCLHNFNNYQTIGTLKYGKNKEITVQRKLLSLFYLYTDVITEPT